MQIISFLSERIKRFYEVSVYRNAAYLTLNSAFLAFIGLGFWILAARLYGADAVGLAAAAISAMGLLATCSIFGLDYSLIRFLPSSKDPSALINTCFVVGSSCALLLSGVFLLGLPLWSPSLLLVRPQPVFLLAFILVTVATTLQTFTRQGFIACRKAALTSVQGLTFGLSKLIFLFFLLTPFGALGIFASWGLGVGIAVVVGILLIIYVVKIKLRLHPLLSIGVLKELLHFSLQNFTVNLLWFVPDFVLPLIVVNVLGAEENAYFYAAWRVAAILNIASMAASFALLAEGSHEEGSLAKSVKQSLNFTFPILLAIVIILLFASNNILLAFGNAYSREAANLLRILAVASIPLSLNLIYFGKKRVEKDMKPVILLAGAISIATIGITAFLFQYFGILAPGIAWLLSQGIAALLIVRQLFN